MILLKAMVMVMIMMVMTMVMVIMVMIVVKMVAMMFDDDGNFDNDDGDNNDDGGGSDDDDIYYDEVCLQRKIITFSLESPVTTVTTHKHFVQLQVGFHYFSQLPIGFLGSRSGF